MYYFVFGEGLRLDSCESSKYFDEGRITTGTH